MDDFYQSKELHQKEKSIGLSKPGSQIEGRPGKSKDDGKISSGDSCAPSRQRTSEWISPPVYHNPYHSYKSLNPERLPDISECVGNWFEVFYRTIKWCEKTKRLKQKPKF